jgi:hypothetical protein
MWEWQYAAQGGVLEADPTDPDGPANAVNPVSGLQMYQVLILYTDTLT